MRHNRFQAERDLPNALPAPLAWPARIVGRTADVTLAYPPGFAAEMRIREEFTGGRFLWSRSSLKGMSLGRKIRPHMSMIDGGGREKVRCFFVFGRK